MNPISKSLNIGTLGELLLQARLLQFDVQAAPPLKDTGNDLIAIRKNQFRSIQVKSTTEDRYRVPRAGSYYHILAAIQLVGNEKEIYFDKCEIYLIAREEIAGLSRLFKEIQHLKLSHDRIFKLFQPA